MVSLYDVFDLSPRSLNLRVAMARESGPEGPMSAGIWTVNSVELIVEEMAR